MSYCATYLLLPMDLLPLLILLHRRHVMLLLGLWDALDRFRAVLLVFKVSRWLDWLHTCSRMDCYQEAIKKYLSIAPLLLCC